MRLARGFHAKLAEVDAALKAGDATRAKVLFDKFWRATRPTWRGIGARLYQKWTPPTGCSPEDVEQELSMATWRLLREGRYNPAKGRTLADYLVFNACNLAKYWLHQQRGASLHGNRDRHATRAPHSFDPLPPGAGERLAAPAVALRRMAVDAVQERAAERRSKLLNLLDECENIRDRFGLVSLYEHGGDDVAAARYMYQHLDIRQLCRFGSEEHAHAAVLRTVHLFAHLDEPDTAPVVAGCVDAPPPLGTFDDL